MRKKFTMLLTALLCCMGGAKAQITSLEELNNGKAYTIEGERGFIAANEGFVMGNNNGPLSGTTLETNNAMHQFAIITYEDVSYLYSVGAEKFVMKDGNKASLVDFPIHSIEIVAAQDQSTNFDWIIKLNGKYMNLSNSSENGVYTNYDSEDGGNRWSITEIGEFNSQKAATVISLGLASERLALQKAINNASSYYEAMKDKNTEEAQTLNNMISEAQGSLTSDAETAESLSEKILNIDLLLYNLISEYDLSSQAFYLKNASTGLYMTLVSTNENIKVCDFDYTNENQVFNIVGTNESYVYKVKSSTGYYLKTTGNWDYKASETDDDGGKHTLAYVGEGKYTLTGSKGLIGPNSGSAKNNDPIYSNHGTNNSNIYWVLEPQDERLKSILLEEIESATTVYDKLKSFTCDEITTLVTAINTANGVYENPSATVDAIIEQIGSLSTAKDEASLYPFVPSLLKEIEPSRYFIYYTDENNTKHYLQTTGANSVVTVTENPISYDIQAGTTEAGKFTTAYTIKMNGLYISNTSNDTTNIETKDQVQLWSSQVVFEMNGKSAIRLTNATAENTWHGHYFIDKGDENTTIASDPSLGENLFIWTIELDLQGMRDELAVLKEKATTLKTQLTNKPEGSAPIENAVITALSTAIEYAEMNKGSNDSETLNTGITQLNDAINNASVNAFGSGVLAMLDEGEYVIYYEKDDIKYYLSNDKTDKKVVTSTSPLVYDVYEGQTNGYATYAYCLDMNESKMSNPNGDMQIQVENKGGNNYNNNREWDSQVLYVNSQGKYAIRSTNCSAGSGWNSDAFITISISENGTTVSGQNTDLSDALYIWNIEKVKAEASINNVKYETLTAAIAAAEAGATVTLIKDIEVSGAVEVTKDLTIDMNGKTLTSDGDGFEVKAGGTLTITGNGTVNAGTEGGLWVAVWANGGNAVIENGTYSVVAGEEGSTNDCIYAKGGEITINGGTFRNNGTYYPNKGGVVINANNTIANSKVIINGGTFNPAEDCVITEEGDVTAERVAWTPVTEEALNVALAASSVVTLGGDIELTAPVVVDGEGKNVTVDLNGHTLKARTFAESNGTITEGETDSYVFWVRNGANLTINGNGKVETSACAYSIAVWAQGGNVTINGGEYTNAGEGADLIYASAAGNVVINGGTFTACEKQPHVPGTNEQRSALNLKDNSGSSITVYGGKYYEFDPANNVSENPQVNFVAVTHHSVYDGTTKYYEVVPGCVINDSDYKVAGKKFVVEETVENVDITYTRTFGHTDWQVLFVPFAIPMDKMSDFEVYSIEGVENSRIVVNQITDGGLDANTPYLIKTNETEVTIELKGATLEATTGNLAIEKNGYTFTGTYKAMTAAELIAADDSYVLTGVRNAEGNIDYAEWRQLTETSKAVLSAFRVYLTAPAGAANALSITRGETGIEELSTVNDQQSTVIYDLTGRKVETMDKGIYIVNGRKVVIK